MENVNHLFLFKGKSQTKTSRLPKCVPSRTSACATDRPIPNLQPPLLHCADTSCSQCACCDRHEKTLGL